MSEAAFRDLFEHIPGLYLVLTPDLTMIAATDAYLEAAMLERSQVIGKQLFDVFPDNPDDEHASGERNLAASLGRVLRTGVAESMSVQRYDIRRPDAEGGGFEERYWSPFSSPILGSDGDVQLIIHRAEDVTEFVRLQQSHHEDARTAHHLRERTERMQAEVLARTGEVQAANAQLRHANQQLDAAVIRLQAADELKTQFLNMASHELRTPLTAIAGFTTTIRELWDQLEDSRKLELLDIVGTQTQRLTRLTDHLLLLSTIESGRLASEYQALKVAPVVHEALVELDLAEAVDVHCTDGVEAVADADQLKQIIINYLTNAVKYGAAPIRVEAYHSGGYVEIRVRDSGSGISDDFVPQLFTEFARADPSRTRTGLTGTGLGLAIVRGLARTQQGEAFYEPNEPHGSCFGVRLPQSPAA